MSQHTKLTLEKKKFLAASAGIRTRNHESGALISELSQLPKVLPDGSLYSDLHNTDSLRPHVYNLGCVHVSTADWYRPQLNSSLVLWVTGEECCCSTTDIRSKQKHDI